MAGDKLHIPDPDDEEGEARREESEQLSWEYTLEFREMARELERRDEIVEVEWSLGDPVPVFTVETIEHGLGTTVPRFVKRFYRLADGLHLEWSLREEGDVVPGGGIHLYDFATVFDSWLDELWTDAEELDEEGRDQLWDFRGFDALPEPGGDRMVVFSVEDVDYPTFDLFLHDLGSRSSHLLALDFRRYLDLLLETRGTYGWVHCCIDSPPDDPEFRQWRERCERRMERLFPEADFEPGAATES